MDDLQVIDVHTPEEAVKLLVQFEMAIKAARSIYRQVTMTELNMDIQTRYLILGILEDDGLLLQRLKADIIDRMQRNAYPFSVVRA